MYIQADKAKENKKTSVDTSVSQQANNGRQTFAFRDLRQESIAQRKLIDLSQKRKGFAIQKYSQQESTPQAQRGKHAISTGIWQAKPIQRALDYQGTLTEEEKSGFVEDMTVEEAEEVLKGKKSILGEKELGLHFDSGKLKGLVGGASNQVSSGDLDAVIGNMDNPDWKKDVLSHNHPSGSPLTETDMLAAFIGRYHEVRAVTPNRVWRCWYEGDAPMASKFEAFNKIFGPYRDGMKTWEKKSEEAKWKKKENVTARWLGATFNQDEAVQKLFGLLALIDKNDMKTDASQHKDAYIAERREMYKKV